MTAVVGGLRSRLIFDNLCNAINAGLTNLGWFQPGQRFASPIRVVWESEDVTTQVPENTLAISDENVNSTPWEVGSQLSEDTRYYYVDFFGESDRLAKHVIGDVRDLLLGKLPNEGLAGPVLPVYDLRQPTPPHLFSCDIIRVTVDRSHDFSHPWLRHWYSIQLSLYDYYNTELD